MSRVVTPKILLGWYAPCFLKTSVTIGVMELTRFEMMQIMASGQCWVQAAARVATIGALVLNRSSLSCLVSSGLLLEKPPQHNLSRSLAPARVRGSLSRLLWSPCGSDLRPLGVSEQYRTGSDGSLRGCPIPPLEAPSTATFALFGAEGLTLRRRVAPAGQGRAESRAGAGRAQNRRWRSWLRAGDTSDFHTAQDLLARSARPLVWSSPFER